MMFAMEVRDMTSDDEYFVGTCSHVNESEEIDACGECRLAWLREQHGRGVRVKVAQVNGEPAGFAYVMPIEACPWGPLGEELAVMPCLWVLAWARRAGVGRGLVAAAEEEARQQQLKALVTTAYYRDDWFMPARFFESCGYRVVVRRKDAAIMWKVFDARAQRPTFLESRYRYRGVPGKVVVDLFWNTFCLTSVMEAERVRQVAAELGEGVVLREYRADDQGVLMSQQTPRSIFVNGRLIGWGHEAPKEGVRAAIQEALGKV